MISTLISLSTLISEIGEDNINNFVKSITLSTIVLFVISLILIVILKLVAIAFNYFKYYDFKLKKDNSKIQISYGFFTKKNYTLNLDNLHAIKIKQSIGQIIFKKSTLSISTFGYGDDKSEEAILFPHINENNVDDILNGLFPKFVYNGDKHRINKKYKFRYKYARIGYNKDILYLSGGIFKKKTSFISIYALDDICMKQLFFQKNRSYFKLKVHYKSMKAFDLRSIKGIDKSHFDELSKYLLN
jgi:putative membrane protein